MNRMGESNVTRPSRPRLPRYRPCVLRAEPWATRRRTRSSRRSRKVLARANSMPPRSPRSSRRERRARPQISAAPARRLFPELSSARSEPPGQSRVERVRVRSRVSTCAGLFPQPRVLRAADVSVRKSVRARRDADALLVPSRRDRGSDRRIPRGALDDAHRVLRRRAPSVRDDAGEGGGLTRRARV